jgi:TonB family protein
MTLLLDSTLKVSVVILTGLAIAAALRNRSAAARHAVVASSIVCALALPVLEQIVPRWGWSSRTQPTVSRTAPTGAATIETPQPAGEPIEFSAAVRADASATPPSRITSAIAPAWLAGAGIGLLLLAIGLGRLTWLASSARRIESGTWTDLADAIARDLGIRRPVHLLESPHPSLLVTWGLWQPKVLLPMAARSWPDDRAAIVLRHELAHIRRGDWIIQLAGEVLRSAYWFNPLLWIACARLRQESEQACDDEVLTSGVAGPDYASHLVELARLLKSQSAQAAPRLPAPAIARSSSLERRVRAMLDARLARTPITRIARLATGGALLAFTVAVASAQTGPVSFSGTVVDETGRPVPDASVVLSNNQSRAKFEVKTDGSGKFQFVPLPADSYTLQTMMPGFKKTEEAVTLSGKRVTRDVRLTLGELQETINIRATLRDAAEATPESTEKRAARLKFEEGARGGFQQELAGCQASSTGGRVRPPRKIKDVKPIYPETMRDSGTAGKVLLKATIATDGTVRDVQVVKSVHPDLDNAAVEAVRQWLFDGTMLNCNPVDVTMNVSIDFGIAQ